MQKFKDTLGNLGWQNVLNFKEVNESFEYFWNDFYALFELHFPLKKMKFNRNVQKIHNYMTKGLLISRNNKLTLKKNHWQILTNFITRINFIEMFSIGS